MSANLDLTEEPAINLLKVQQQNDKGSRHSGAIDHRRLISEIPVAGKAVSAATPS